MGSKRNGLNKFQRHQARRRSAEIDVTERQPPRAEPEILAELQALCHSPGFAHLVAHIIVRDNFIFYRDEMKPEDMANLFGMNRLIRTEVATLIGYMVQGSRETFDAPPDDPQTMLAKVEALLKELHRRLNWSVMGEFSGSDMSQFLAAREDAKTLREPIFYGGESAFNFQYRDFAVPKYRADNDWIVANRGFTIEQASAVIDSFLAVMEAQTTALWKAMAGREAGEWSLLPGFLVNVGDVVARSNLAPEIVDKVIDAFATKLGENKDFQALNDFNLASAAPLIALGDGQYAVLQHYPPVEALYEAPFYWMVADKSYRATASANRGAFTEAFTYQRLVDVFGAPNVHRNLNLDRAKGARLGEIDILVEFGGRVLVVQVKSKRLTIEARRGHEGKLREDFKGAVQDAYDQALSCAEALLDPSVRISDSNGNTVTLRSSPSKIYPICLVADHYPALVAQTDRFLTRRTVKKVAEPMITDIFALDSLSELLDRPLRLLGYCELRDRFADRFIFSHELSLLSCHVRQNLWMNDDIGGILLDDTINAPLEIAMLARRRDIPGEKTPKGPLTAFAGTPFDGMLARIEARPDPPMVDLGLFMLEASGRSINAFNEGVEMIAEQARKDARPHDFSIALGDQGLTVHCSFERPTDARARLEAHVEARKYACRADRWFGLFISPADGLPIVGFVLDFPWEEDPLRAELAAHLPKVTRSSKLPTNLRGFVRPERAAGSGRNGPCPCGSGRKSKKCCGN